MAPLKKATLQRKAAAVKSVERRRKYKTNPPKSIHFIILSDLLYAYFKHSLLRHKTF